MRDPTKIQIKILGIFISAEGAIGTAAAVFIVVVIVLASRF